MQIIKKVVLSLAGMVGLGSLSSLGSHPKPLEFKTKVKFTTAPSECSEAEHERRHQAALDKRERRAERNRKNSKG